MSGRSRNGRRAQGARAAQSTQSAQTARRIGGEDVHAVIAGLSALLRDDGGPSGKSLPYERAVVRCTAEILLEDADSGSVLRLRRDPETAALLGVCKVIAALRGQHLEEYDQAIEPIRRDRPTDGAVYPSDESHLAS